ncbi:MAG: DsrE family protein [bacterium]|nr:DsrE family protein [bacterium]
MNKKVMLVITHSTDDPDRANGAIALATALLGEEADLVLFFIFQGAKMVQKGVAESIAAPNFTPVRELFPMIVDAKIPMYVCSPCVKTHKIPPDQIVEGVQIVAASTLAAESMERQTITF